MRRNRNPLPEVTGFIWKYVDGNPTSSAPGKTLGHIISPEPCHFNLCCNTLWLDIGNRCLNTPTELCYKHTLFWQDAIPKDKLITRHICIHHAQNCGSVSEMNNLCQIGQNNPISGPLSRGTFPFCAPNVCWIWCCVEKHQMISFLFARSLRVQSQGAVSVFSFVHFHGMAIILFMVLPRFLQAMKTTRSKSKHYLLLMDTNWKPGSSTSI